MSMLTPELQAQMDALQQAANNRARGPFDLGAPNISQGFGASDQFNSNSSMSSMAQAGNQAQPGQQPSQQQKFLGSVQQVMLRRHTALPQFITGLAGIDPSPVWNNILQPGSQVGCFRLAGKDVNVFVLWNLVRGGGGPAQINNRGGWPTVLQRMELPAHSPTPLPPNGTHNTAEALAQIYALMLTPFDDIYQQNINAQQQKLRQTLPQGMPTQPVVPAQLPTSGFPDVLPPLGSPSITAPLDASTISSPLKVESLLPLETEMNGLKRKSEFDDESKRSRLKLEPTDSLQMNGDVAASAASGGPQEPSRRKIQYVPLAREVETYGGHDLRDVTTALHQPRALREVKEWGTVDIEAVTLSIRSRLPLELSYGLTVLSMLSTTRQAHNPRVDQGYPLKQTPELLDELLDLLEETAFADQGDLGAMGEPVVSNRKLLDNVFEAESWSFAPLKAKRQKGFTPSSAHIVISLSNILRNMTATDDNAAYIVQQGRTIPLLLRLCGVSKTGTGEWQPSSPALSLAEVIGIRKDVLYILNYVAENIELPRDVEDTTPAIKLTVSRIINLLSSYLVDATEAVSPLATVRVPGMSAAMAARPPTLADVAIETLNRFGQLDGNRNVLSKTLSETDLWSLMESLVHRLPVSDADFQLLRGEFWLLHVERLLMGIYTIAFIASPKFKARAKKDRQLSVTSILSRIITKLSAIPPENRAAFSVATRRCIETLKVFDDAKDSFETRESVTVQTLAFGMGYGEGADTASERGNGLFGWKRDWALNLLVQPDICSDETMFKELESLARVEV